MSHFEEPNYKKPLYQQLRDVIRDKIITGEYAPGTAIPSENELASKYGVHRLTVRNTIEILVDEGLLITKQGSGIYVTGKKKQMDIDQFPGYKKSLKDKRAKEKAAVIVNSPRVAGPYYAKLFNIKEYDQIHYVCRLLKTNHSPVSVEKFYIPFSVIPNLDSIDFSIFSTYEVLDFYHIDIHRTVEKLEVSYVDLKMAKRLKIKEENPVFLFSVVGYGEMGVAIFSYESYTRADKSEFVISYTR